jgi:threonine synthase
MVTQKGKNVSVAAVKGNFDDTQRSVKRIFADKNFNNTLFEKGYILSSANSINIGRLIPQIIYYYYSYVQMVRNNNLNFGEKINFCVPTGNFGNILAAYYAKKMGLPVDKLYCASNSNKVLFDYFSEGEYDINREFILTCSPSMDILTSSNLERLLYDLSDSKTVQKCMGSLAEKGVFRLDSKNSGIIPCFANDDETFAAIRKIYCNSCFAIDTHTAVAVAGLEKIGFDNKNTVIVSTASAYKFPERVVFSITGKTNGGISELSALYNDPIPKSLKEITSLPILHSEVITPEQSEQFICSCI